MKIDPQELSKIKTKVCLEHIWADAFFSYSVQTNFHLACTAHVHIFRAPVECFRHICQHSTAWLSCKINR